MPETETTEVLDTAKPSKLKRVGKAATTAGIIVIPTAVMVGITVVSFKTSVNNVEAAKLTLEAAKLAAQQA